MQKSNSGVIGRITHKLRKLMTTGKYVNAGAILTQKWRIPNEPTTARKESTVGRRQNQAEELGLIYSSASYQGFQRFLFPGTLSTLQNDSGMAHKLRNTCLEIAFTCGKQRYSKQYQTIRYQCSAGGTIQHIFNVRCRKVGLVRNKDVVVAEL